MKKYFINEQETFAVNEELNARVEVMGWQEFPIVYIDNFYKNPDKVRNLALRCPPTNNPRICGGVPGTRVDMNMNLDHMHEVWKSIADNVYGMKMGEVNTFDQACLQVPFSVNVTQSKDRVRLPHIDYPFGSDGRGWAGLIYLNKGKECQGGTGFYNYKGQQVNPSQDGIWDEDYVADSVGPWELIHLAEMKYNRMIFYPDSVLHGAYDKPGFFEGDNYRLVQVFFLPLHFPQ
tara:strand:+ start:10977 stop:11675 length:699 start_codon:yes stop_codon:yes gene_type:complete